MNMTNPGIEESPETLTEDDAPIILCVDDDNLILFCLKMQIKNFFHGDCRIELAESGLEALEIIENMLEDDQRTPDLIISDQIMPGMKGHELLENIHLRFPGITKVMLTGMAMHDDIQKAMEGANLFRVIKKPWPMEVLMETLQEGLGQSQRQN